MIKKFIIIFIFLYNFSYSQEIVFKNINNDNLYNKKVINILNKELKFISAYSFSFNNGKNSKFFVEDYDFYKKYNKKIFYYIKKEKNRIYYKFSNSYYSTISFILASIKDKYNIGMTKCYVEFNNSLKFSSNECKQNFPFLDKNLSKSLNFLVYSNKHIVKTIPLNIIKNTYYSLINFKLETNQPYNLKNILLSNFKKYRLKNNKKYFLIGYDICNFGIQHCNFDNIINKDTYIYLYSNDKINLYNYKKYKLFRKTQFGNFFIILDNDSINIDNNIINFKIIVFTNNKKLKLTKEKLLKIILENKKAYLDISNISNFGLLTSLG